MKTLPYILHLKITLRYLFNGCLIMFDLVKYSAPLCIILRSLLYEFLISKDSSCLKIFQVHYFCSFFVICRTILFCYQQKRDQNFPTLMQMLVLTLGRILSGCDTKNLFDGFLCLSTFTMCILFEMSSNNLDITERESTPIITSFHAFVSCMLKKNTVLGIDENLQKVIT